MHVFQVEDKRRQLNVCNYLTDTPFDSILKAIQHTTHTRKNERRIKLYAIKSCNDGSYSQKVESKLFAIS